MLRTALPASLALLLVPLAACGKGPAGGAAIPQPTGAIVPVPAPEPGPSPDEVLARIEAGGAPEHTCFAFAPGGSVMCSIGSSSIQGGAAFSVDILGPGEETFDWYQHADDSQFFEIDAGRIDHDAFARARAAATTRGFTGWGGPWIAVEVGQPTEVGGVALRRTRTELESGSDETGSWASYQDVIELDCGGRWVAVPFADPPSRGSVFGNQIEAANVEAVQLGDKLLFTATVSWGEEGDQGAGQAAELIDPVAACQ